MSPENTLTPSPEPRPPHPLTPPVRRSALTPALHQKIQALTKTGPVLLKEPPPQHGDAWTCPATGIVIPKTLAANLKWRERVREEAEFDPEFQSQIRAACGASPWLWLNLFGWTFRQKRVLPNGEEVPCIGHEAHHPFITWRVQDEFIGELSDAITGGHDVLIDKSRDMGASWVCLAVIHWFWQFRPSVTFMELSRKEDYVDRLGNMDSLFEKHRYLLKWQPYWMKPRRITDKYMTLVNHDTGSQLIGESTNGDAGRGGRKTAILLDEFAAVENGAKVTAATADTTACRIYNSTPGGPGTEFTRIKREKRARLLALHWVNHPEKGKGAYQVLDENGKPKWVSPWYLEEAKRRSKQEMAQEIDMNHGQAGDMFFDEDTIESHRRAHARPPVVAGDLTLDDDYGDEAKKRIVTRRAVHAVRFTEGADRPTLRLWVPLIDGRPSQNYTYVFGADISAGTGASNSVISVAAAEIGMKVAELSSPHLSPEKLAEMAAWMGLWFGGLWGPLIAFELNGPGAQFGRRLVKDLEWPYYYKQRVDATKAEDKGVRYGWFSNMQRKQVLVGRYRTDLEKHTIINPSNESLDEALDYVTDENGQLIPGRLKAETNGARATHGDRVIADALLRLAIDELPRHRDSAARTPAGSYAARKAAHDKAKREADEWH